MYKEDLEEVIKPTFASVKPAMEAYRKIGGTVKVVICDDGLQVLCQPALPPDACK